MTAEIAIMNLQAIALAADSAVTVEHAGGGSKIFQAANKIFALSPLAPVGILVYGSAAYMGIPWETLIKEYRRIHGMETHDRLEGYASNFRQFLVAETPTYLDYPSDFSIDAQSGIVIAGFGSLELLPSWCQIIVQDDGTELRIIEIDPVEVDPVEQRAVVQAFAQSDMIAQFMEGSAPEYDKIVIGMFSRYLDQYSNNIVSLIPQSLSINTDALRDQMKKYNASIAESINESLGRIRQEHARGIVGVVASLPKEDLAGMAEALVDLTSLKRRVSLEAETVGGPTDVAVITKGDGMVWIKRKQYFPPELNHGYMARTYGRRGHGATIDQGEEAQDATGGAPEV